MHAFFESKTERRSAINKLKVLLADVDKVAHRVHVAVYEGRENSGIVRDIRALDRVPLPLQENDYIAQFEEEVLLLSRAALRIKLCLLLKHRALFTTSAFLAYICCLTVRIFLR